MRMRCERLLGAWIVLGCLIAGGSAAQDLSAAELVTTRLSDTISMIETKPPMAGNLAVSAGPSGIMLVDDQMMPITDKIKAAIREIQDGRVDFVINTHYHFDHAGGNEAFGAESTIVAHTNVRERLAEGREAGNRFIDGERPLLALPVITFDESVTFHWNGEQVDVIHLERSAHTDGDAVIFFRGSNVLHTGDQYINLGGFPYIDRDVGGSAIGLRDNLAELLEMVDDETRIIPGHGPLATKADLARFHDFVSRSIAEIERRKKAGESLESLQQAGLPDEFDAYGKGFIAEPAWIGFVYGSLDD